MAFRCLYDPSHESTDDDKCSICSAAGDPEAARPAIAVAVASAAGQAGKKVPRQVPRFCWNCGLNWSSDELICKQCGCEYLPGDIDMSPPGQSTTSAGATPTSAILEKVLSRNKDTTNSPPILMARLTVDLKRRDCRPVDEKPPADHCNKKFAMDQELLPFGRSSTWMEINDAGVSRLHGEFVRQSDGSYCLRDVGSANGTHIDGLPLAPGVLRKVKPGDEIMVGFWHVIIINWGDN